MKRLRLLCVDDDAGIRELYHSMFTGCGHEVTLAASPGQALDVLRTLGSRIDGVISDYEMPEMNGAQLAAVVKKSRPDLPFVVISGSSPDLGETSACVDLTLQKGCPVKELIDKVEKALAPRPSRISALSEFMPLGSVLAGAASAAFLLSRLLR